MSSPAPTPAASGAWLPASHVLAACSTYRAHAVADLHRHQLAQRSRRFHALTRRRWWAPWRDTSTEAALLALGPDPARPTWDEVRIVRACLPVWTCDRLQALAEAAAAARRPVWVAAADVHHLAGCWVPLETPAAS